MEELLTMSIEGVHVTSYALEQVTTLNNDMNRQIDDYFTVTLCYQSDNLNSDERSFTFTLEEDADHRDQLFLAFAIEAFDTLDIDTPIDYCIIEVVAESCEILLQQVSELGRKSLAMFLMIEVDQDYVVDDDDGVIIDPVSTFELKNYLSSYNGVRFISVDQVESHMDCCSICLAKFEKRKNNNGDGEEDDDVAALLCSHAFHGDCFIPWIAMGKNTCLLCRYNLVSN